MPSLFNSAAAIGPEAQLLVCSASISSDDEVRETQTLLQSSIDWRYLLRAAYDHAVIPLLYRRLSTCSKAVPAEILSSLREDSLKNSRSSLALTRELLELLALFEDHEISTIPYKGPTLAASAYGDIGLRQFVDLDLIVHRQDVLKVKELLVARGWQPEFELNDAQEAAFLDHYYDYGFRNGQGMLIEIHWELTEGFFTFPIDIERLWDRLVPVTIAGRRLMTLSPEDSLLIVCVHSSKHLWSRLGWISDVARLIETNKDIDWTFVFDHAAALGSRRMLSIGLLLASELGGASLPGEISREVQSDSAAKAVVRELRGRLFEERESSPGIAETARLHLRMRERLRDRATYCLRLTLGTTVGDWTSMKLPRPFLFLYYLLRPFRLAGKYGRRLVNRILSGGEAR